MPSFSLTTNRDLSPEAEKEIIREAAAAVKEVLGKPEEFLISMVRGGATLQLGLADEPAAWIEFRALGLPVEEIPRLAERFSESVSRIADLSEDRVYLVCEDVPRTHWAKGRKTFG